jgi:hypothetical protein
MNRVLSKVIAVAALLGLPLVSGSSAAQEAGVPPPPGGRGVVQPPSSPNPPFPPPNGWTCVGYCGSDPSDGVVSLSPANTSMYTYITTAGGTSGVGGLPSGNLGSESNGSTITSPTFTATAGAPLAFYFDYITSDGADYDYAWAELFTSTGTPVALLFGARTKSSGSIIPGTAMPNPAATLTPASVPIIPGAPTWAGLGGDSGNCVGSGCGYTGWVNASYTITTSGSYYVKFGVTNWIDGSYNSGLALDALTVSGTLVTTSGGGGRQQAPGLSPVGALAVLIGLTGFGFFFVTRRQRTQT